MPQYTRPGGVGPASAGDFVERMTVLKKQVGTGTISSEVKVDQIYARRQHQNPQYAHPRGGEAFYLRNALLSTYQGHLQRVAAEVYRGNISQLFVKYGEQLARETSRRTPLELGNLKRSGSVTVKDRGRVIYRRPATQRRMSRTELNRRVRLHHLESLRGRFNRGR